MIQLVKNFMKLCKEKSRQIKISVVFGFFDGIFEAFPFYAIFYFFLRLSQEKFVAENLTVKDALVLAAILFVGVLGRWIMKYLVYTFQSVASYDAVADARLDVGDHLKKVPMGFFTSNTVGNTVTTLTDDMHFMEQNAANILEKTVNGCINVFVLTICMFYFDLRMGAAFFVGALISLWIIGTMQKKGAKISTSLKESQMEVNNKMIEYINGITLYKLFPRATNLCEDMEGVFENLGTASFRLEKSFIGKNFCYLLVERLICGIIVIAASFLALAGDLDAVKAIVLLIATFVLYKPLENLGAISGLIRMMDISMKRINKMEELPVMNGEGKTVDSYQIQMEHVAFSYEETQENAINDVTVTIPSNKMTAIVGPSGCGKTTITRLIARFFDVDKGSITIGGVNVKEIDPEDLYKYFSIVFQDVFLFHDSIENNIKFGRTNATHEEVVEAAKKACCHEFIEKLPNGYQTIVGEDGSNLSGGEKQRISMARAILKDAPIIILDEATSSVDPENEWMMVQAIDELVKGKTVIMIAHKMRTIMNADQIIVMEKGSIHGLGTHSELLEKDSIYKKFWETRQNAANWKI